MNQVDDCSPPTTVLGIETREDRLLAIDKVFNCSPPTTVLGIETFRDVVTVQNTIRLQPSHDRPRY